MISLQPVKDKAYTLDDDILMKKGYHRMPDGSMMRDEDHIMKKGKRGQKQKQKQKQSVVIRNVININKKERKRRSKPKPKTEKREIRPLPSYSISTGASGASFTPFYPPAPLYRNMTIASPPTTNDDITTSQKRTAELRTGTILNKIEQKEDALNPLEKIEQVIIKQKEPIITEKEQPPSFEEAIGSIEYKTEDEKDKIERIKINYEKGLTLKNQKRREAYARKKIAELERQSQKLYQETAEFIEKDTAEAGRIFDENMKRIKDESKQDLLKQSNDLIERMNQEPTPNGGADANKEKKSRRTKKEIDESKMMQEADKQKQREDTQKVYDDLLAEFDQDELEKIGIKEIIKGNSSSSDENMSSRVQSLKRGHITPMLARYI